MSRLALCIPAYKAEEHLPRLMASVRAQTVGFDEVIVCVDASPDKTAEVARGLGATVLVNAVNQGCSASKNVALRAATAEWVHFHDADDLLMPHFVEDAQRWMTADAPHDAVMMGFEYVDFASGEKLGVGLQEDAFLQRDAVGYAIRHKLPNFGIYRREKLLEVGGFDADPGTLYNEDVAFHVKLALAGWRFRASQEVTSINYRHGGSMSGANALKCEVAHYEVMRRAAQVAEARHGPEIAARLWKAATNMAAMGAWPEARAALKAARVIFPGVPPRQGRGLSLLARVLGPVAAFRLREGFIRGCKPHLRSAS